MALERLQKIIARAGIASRRKAEELILAERVTVNGTVASELGSKADPATDGIRVDGKPIHAPRQVIYLALNKPRGCVTTLSDPEGRPTVMDYLKGIQERVYPVGRLDFHTEGLLLLTNDGEFANRVMAGASGVPKTYWVKVAGPPKENDLERLRRGIVLDGRKTRPAEIRFLRRDEAKLSGQKAGNPWFEMVLREGRQNQIRRMFERIGNPVRKLKRVGIGPVKLGRLALGTYRLLTAAEIRSLRRGSRAEKASVHRHPQRQARRDYKQR